MDVSFKNQCVTLRRKGHSVNEIMRITERAKTSIYTHIQNIPLSAERWKQIRRASGEHIRKFAIARTGKSVRPFKKFVWNEKTVFLTAHLLFDGEIHRTVCAYNNRSRALIERVAEAMREVYEFEPKHYTNPLTGVSRISYFNVELGEYMRQKSEELLVYILRMPLSFKREFVRAFFDDEGCMYFRRNIKRVRGYQKNTDILLLIQTLLLDFGITSRIHQPNEVVVTRKQDLRTFQKEIGFSPGIYVNGDRSNSIWKEHLEKREILRRAIVSFKS